MVGLASHGDQRLHRRRLAGGNIGRAEVSVVGKQCFCFAQRIRQSDDLVQHWLKLLLVIGGLHHIGRHHQQAALGHHRLGVVAWLEPATRHRHDAGFSSVRLTWSVGSGPATGGWGGLPPGCLPVASIFASRASIFA